MQPLRRWSPAPDMEGMSTLFENGCHAVEQGLTTFEELLRVLGLPHVS